MWWNTLTPVEQSSIGNIDMLVSSGEQIKMTEMGAWADSQQSERAQLSREQLNARNVSEAKDGYLSQNKNLEGEE